MKWLVITGAVALVLGLALRHEAKISRSRDPSFNPECSSVIPETSPRESNSFSPSRANQIPSLPLDRQPIIRAESLTSLLSAIEGETDVGRRGEALDRTIESISEARLPVVLDSLMGLDGPTAAEVRERLVRRWAESDAATAAAWAAQLSEGSARCAAFEQIAFVWGEADLASAVAWVHTLPDGGSGRAATLATAYEAARTDPLTALELAHHLQPSVERDDLLVHALSQWAGSDFAAAAEWAGKVADPQLRTRLIVAAATASAELDPATAATLIATDVDAGEVQERAAVALTQRWAQSAPRDAAAWVLQFPESLARDAAAKNLVTLWTAQDAEAAGQWLGELPEGTLRTVGLSAPRLALALPGVTASVE